MNVETCALYFAGTARGPEKDRMSTQAYYKERLGFDPADTVAEHQREQRSQHGYEESLSKFKGQNANGFPEESPKCNGVVGEHRAGNTQAFWGCWAMFIEAHGRCSRRGGEERERWRVLACGCCKFFVKKLVFFLLVSSFPIPSFAFSCVRVSVCVTLGVSRSSFSFE